MLETSRHAWYWLKGGILKKENEVLLTAAQDQALRTSYIKNKINGQDVSPMRKNGGNQYKSWRHDKVAQVLHWNLCM